MPGNNWPESLQKPDEDEKSWVVTGTKGMFAYPPGEETIKTGTDSLSSIVGSYWRDSCGWSRAR